MKTPELERRTEARREARREVQLFIEGPRPFEIHGRLMDTSNSGFRMSHQYQALCPGQEIRFRYAIREGRARVIWTRLLPEGVESGLVVLV